MASKQPVNAGEPLRVLIASGVYPPQIGGPAIQSELFARELARRGVEVRVITQGPPAETATEIQVDYLDHMSGGGPLAACRRHWSIARQISRLFREFRPHAVQMQSIGGLFPLTVGILARFYRTPSWVKFAGHPVIEPLSRRAISESGQRLPAWKSQARTALGKLLARLIFRAHGFVWATTPTVAEELVSRWGISRERIVIAPNLVDLGDLSRASEMREVREGDAPLRLLMVTRLEPIKGVDVAIRALAELTHTPSVLRVLGDGQQRYVDSLRSLTEQLGVSSRVDWAGKFPREDLPEEYRRADLLLVPSRYEAFGVVIVEAMAAGLPVVASRVGGIADVVRNGQCARLVQPGDPAELARAIEELAGDHDEIARLVREGIGQAQNFEAGAGVGKWLEIYRSSTKASATPAVKNRAA